MNDISAFLLIISLLCLWLVVIIHIYNFDGSHDAHGEEDIPAWQKQQQTETPKFNCLLFNDGRLAVLDSECDTAYPEISWFLSKGYHIDAAVIDADYYVHELYMSR